MLALRKARPEVDGLSLDEINSPASPKAGEVLLKVLGAGICGTDLHIFKWHPFAHRMKLPTVLGHEMCGIVEAVGEGVTRVKVGVRVSVESHVPCGMCYTCHRGWSHVCPNTRYPGVDFDGGFASSTCLPESIVWPIPDQIDTRSAAMMEPLGIAVHASLESSGVSGQNVVIAGCGPIGLMNVAVARALGANRVIATDVNPLRLEMAIRMGADRAVDVSKEDPADVVRDLTRGCGADVVIEYSGQAASLVKAPELVTNGGEIRLIGVPEGAIALNLEPWLFKGLRILNLHGRRLFSSWAVSTRLLVENKIDIKPLVSHVLPITDAKKGFSACFDGSAIKVILTNGKFD